MRILSYSLFQGKTCFWAPSTPPPFLDLPVDVGILVLHFHSLVDKYRKMYTLRKCLCLDGGTFRHSFCAATAPR